MGNLNLQSVLSGRNLSGTIQAVAAGLPAVLHPGFESQTPRGVEGNTATYYKVEGTRKTAQLVHYGAPSKARTLSGVNEKPVTLAHFAENVGISAHTLVNLMDENEKKQRLGEAEVARLVQEAKQIMVNTRRATIASAAATGYIYYDKDGNLLASSSGAQITVDFGIPSGNRGQLNVFGDGAIIDASWGAASTKIVKHMQLLAKATLKLTGYNALENAIYGENILDYFLGNTQLKEIISRFPAFQAGFSSGIIPDGFLGVKKWWPGYQFFYSDKDGTLQPFVGGDNIIFHPDPDPTWYELLEGTTPVPGELGLAGGDLSDAIASIDLQQGMYSYAKVTDDPVSATMIYGDNFLPVIKVPKAVFIADVTP